MRRYFILMLICVSCHAYPPRACTSSIWHPLADLGSNPCVRYVPHQDFGSRLLPFTSYSDDAPGIMLHFLSSLEGMRDVGRLSEEEWRRPHRMTDEKWLAKFIKNKQYHMVLWAASQIIRSGIWEYNQHHFPLLTQLLHAFGTATFCGELCFEEGWILFRMTNRMIRLWHEAGHQWQRDQLLKAVSLSIPQNRQVQSRVVCMMCSAALADHPEMPFVRTCENEQHIVCGNCWERENEEHSCEDEAFTLKCLVPQCTNYITYTRERQSYDERVEYKAVRASHQIKAVARDAYLYVSIGIVVWLIFMQWSDFSLLMHYT